MRLPVRETGSVRVITQGLSLSYSKLLLMKIRSNRLTAPGSPTGMKQLKLHDLFYVDLCAGAHNPSTMG